VFFFWAFGGCESGSRVDDLIREIVAYQVAGTKPVTALPGQTPHSPVTALAPPLVIVVAATTPNVTASPKVIAAARSSMDGRATPMTLVVMRARTASLLRLNMMSIEVLQLQNTGQDIEIEV